MPGGKRKGLNKVFWNMRLTPPKVATGSTKPDYSAFIAPQVLPGVYTIKISYDGKEYTGKVNMLHNEENKDLNRDNRQELFDQTMQLYHAHEKLAVVADAVVAEQKMLKAAAEKIKNAKTKKIADDYLIKLENFRSTLLATKQSSPFADERKLREEITEIYLTLCGQEVAMSNLQKQNVSTVLGKLNDAEQKKNNLLAEINNHAKLKEYLSN